MANCEAGHSTSNTSAMSSAPSNPAASDANTIGKRRQDASESSSPQGDSSCVSSSVESTQSPLLKSPQAKSPEAEPARRTPPPRPAAKLPLTRRQHFLEAPLQPHQLQLHQLQNHRLEQLGQVMPLKERLHCLQTGHCLSGFQHAVGKYAEKSRDSWDSQPRVDSPIQLVLTPDSLITPTPDSLITETWDASVAALDYEQEAQMRFNLYVQEYMTPIDWDLRALPADVEILKCECNKPCALRVHVDPEYQGACLWVCVGGNCMFLEEVTKADGTCIVFKEGVPRSVSKFTIPTDAQTGEFQHKVDFDQMYHWMAAGNTDAVFRLQAELLIELHTDAEQTLTRNLSVPECHCQEMAKAVIDKVTGGIFFVCRNRACYFVRHGAEELPDIGRLDIGQFLQLGDSVLDKYTNLQYGMRWFGYTFSKRFWHKLANQPVDSDYHHGAFKLEPGEEYTGFLSYRGGSGRWFIQTTLCGQFNIVPAFYFMVVFCPIVAICLAQIPDICESSNASSWEWLVFSDGCSFDATDRSWFIFRSYGRSILAVIVLFWHPVFSWLYRGQKLFIDKYCIHQSDIHGRNAPGVARLPLFLQNSQKLLVLFDSEYTTRLWCVFELAVYLRLRKDPKVVFISLDKRFLGVAEMVFLMAVTFITLGIDVIEGATTSDISSALAAVGGGRSYNCQLSPDYCSTGYEISVWFGYVGVCCLGLAGYFLAERYYRALRTLRSTLANFDVVNTNLGIEKDRALLLGIIDQLFTEQDADDRVVVLDGALVADAPHPGGHLSPHTRQAHEVAHQVAHLVTSQQQPGQDEIHSVQHDQSEAHTLVDQPEAHTPVTGHHIDSPAITTHQSRCQVVMPSGLAAFNRSVRTDVYNQLPITGVRSWNIFGYCTAVLLDATWLAYSIYDAWGFIQTGDSPGASDVVARFAYQNMRSVFALAYYILVMNPFLLFFFSAQIKLFLWLYELSGLPRWANYAVFLPVYLFVELILGLRVLVAQNILNLVVVDLMAGATTDPNKHAIWYTPFCSAISTFLQLYHNRDEPFPEWYSGYIFSFDKTVALDVLLWIFLVVPITIFTYWLYEPMRLQKYRLQFWDFLMQKLFGAGDAATNSRFKRRSATNSQF